MNLTHEEWNIDVIQYVALHNDKRQRAILVGGRRVCKNIRNYC